MIQISRTPPLAAKKWGLGRVSLFIARSVAKCVIQQKVYVLIYFCRVPETPTI